MLMRRGFTLIELLIALALFSVMSLLAWRGLDAVLQSRAAVETPARAALELAAAWTQLEADLMAARATASAPTQPDRAVTPNAPAPMIEASAQQLALLRAPSQCAGCWEGVVYDVAGMDGDRALRRRSTAAYEDAESAHAALAALMMYSTSVPDHANLPAGTTEHVLLRGAAGMRISAWRTSPDGLSAWAPLGSSSANIMAATSAQRNNSATNALKVDWQLRAPWDGWVSKVILLENRW